MQSQDLNQGLLLNRDISEIPTERDMMKVSNDRSRLFSLPIVVE